MYDSGIPKSKNLNHGASGRGGEVNPGKNTRGKTSVGANPRTVPEQSYPDASVAAESARCRSGILGGKGAGLGTGGGMGKGTGAKSGHY